MEKTLPADIYAERAALGSILLDREAIIEVAPWLFGEYFYVDKHEVIYDAQLACYNRRVPPDLVNVSDELRRQDKLELVGGVPYLMELVNSVPTAVHVEYYSRIVERTALLRRLISAGGKIAALGFDEREDLDSTLDAAEAEIYAIRAKRDSDSGFSSMVDVADDLMELSERAASSDGLPLGVMTGYQDLDDLLGGMYGGDLVILAARPAVGKTGLALGIANNRADKGDHVAFVSLEMKKKQLGARMMGIRYGYDVQKTLAGAIPPDDHHYNDHLGEISHLPISINDSESLHVSTLRSQIRYMHTMKPITLLIVDYLQLLEGRGENRQQEVSFISRQLKAIAMELDIPVLALSQLNRAVEHRSSQVPTLADLRESGGIEQDASIVMFIYREELYDPNTDKKGIAEIHVAKNRNGPTGVSPMRFFKSATKFASLEAYRTPEGY